MSPIRPENRDRYPDDWSEISRRIRFERAAGQCECHGECGRGTHEGRCPNRHGKPAYGTGSCVVLTTAHLDHTPEHCDDDNLRAMCQGCHLHYDREHHVETRRATREAELGLVPLFVCDEPNQRPDGVSAWTPTGRMGRVDAVEVAELTADEQATADRFSRINYATAPITVTVQAEPTAMRDMQLLLGLVATLTPSEDLL